MAKTLLSPNEVNKLMDVLVGLFAHIKELKKEAIAQHIQYPKIPPVLSESLVVHLLRGKIILPTYPFIGVQMSNDKGDVVGYLSNVQSLKIEVKATASSGFQLFSQKDVESDILVWVHFGNYFKQPEKSKIIIYCLPQPANVFKKSRKITFSKFIEMAQDYIQITELDGKLFGNSNS